MANTSGAVYAPIEVEAEINSQTVDETRWAFTAKDPEVFAYDLDGNLTSDGRWTYEWDGENRLEAMETITTVATAFPDLKQRLEFAYDHQGRRIAKEVYEWDSGTSSFTLHTSTLFVYDHWNLIEERDALDGDAILRTHVWGPDLSGTMQRAGGVGGLLWTEGETQTFAPSTDANGNIVAWINTASKAVAGRLNYSPFGEPIVRTGVANHLPFGFSTKYTDTETDLLYYGHRYLDPSTGRWLSRDPIEEFGGSNLYLLVDNDPITEIDVLGLHRLPPPVKVESFTVAPDEKITRQQGGRFRAYYDYIYRVKFTLTLEPCYHPDQVVITQAVVSTVRREWRPDEPRGGAWWRGFGPWLNGFKWMPSGDRDFTTTEPIWKYSETKAQWSVAFWDSPGMRSLHSSAHPLRLNFAFRTVVIDRESGNEIAEASWGVGHSFDAPGEGDMYFYGN